MQHPVTSPRRLLLAALLYSAAGVACANGHAPDGTRATTAPLRPQGSGVVPLHSNTRLGYDLGLDDDAGVTGKVTTLHTLSKTDMLNLRLEKEGGRAYWSRSEGGQEQRAGLFGTDFGGGERRVLGWQYADGYAAGGENLPQGSGLKWTPTAEGTRSDAPTLSPPAITGLVPGLILEDEVGKRARDAYSAGQGQVREVFRAEPFLPDGRHDFKLAAGGAVESRAPFVGGQIRRGLTSEWTVEAGGYADTAAGVFARSRLRLGGGELKMESRASDETQDSAHRAAYVFRNAALTAEHQQSGASVGARLHGSNYYTAFDHGMGDTDSRLSAGYSTALRSGRMDVHCELRRGEEDSRYCGVGVELPLQPGAKRPEAASGFFRNIANRNEAGGTQHRVGMN